MDLSGTTQPSSSNRLKQRLQRVEQKIENENTKSPNHSNENENSTSNNVNTNNIESEILKSVLEVEKRRNETLNEVNDIILSSNLTEKKRRIQTTQNKTTQISKLEKFFETGLESNNEINQIFQNIKTNITKKNESYCMQLYNDILQCKIECNKLIQDYKNTEKSNHNLIKKKCGDYVSLLKKQEKEILDIIFKMHESINQFKHVIENELMNVEKILFNDRKELIKAKFEELNENYFETFKKQEFEIINKTNENNASYFKQLNDIIENDEESYNKVKINLENHIQLLSQELFQMKSIYQLNKEKLNYNYAILKEREKENIINLDNLKKKEKKLHNALTNIKEKYEKENKKLSNINNELTNEYKKITIQYSDLKNLFKNFEVNDVNKLNNIKKINQDAVYQVLNKLGQVDKIINTQILNIPHVPFDLDFPLNITNNIVNNKNELNSQNNKINLNQKSDMEHRTDTIAILKLLIQEASFLVPQKIKDISYLMTEKEKILYKSDSILRSLDIEDMDDLEDLISLFMKEIKKKNLKNNNTTQQRDENGEMRIELEGFEVIGILKQFIIKRDHSKTTDSMTGIKSIKSMIALQEKEERRKKKDDEYWNGLLKIFGGEKKDLWIKLNQYMEKYYDVLKERENELKMIDELNQENEKLKKVLNGYIKNENELIIPPNVHV